MAAVLLPDLTQLLPALQTAAHVAAPRAAEAVRQYVPVAPHGDHAGAAARSLYAEATPTPAGAEIAVLSDDPVVRYLLDGTPPHVITATHYLPDGRLGFLRFEATDGGVVYAHEVHHPGTPATRFDLAAGPDLDTIADQIIDMALTQVLG